MNLLFLVTQQAKRSAAYPSSCPCLQVVVVAAACAALQGQAAVLQTAVVAVAAAALRKGLGCCQLLALAAAVAAVVGVGELQQQGVAWVLGVSQEAAVKTCTRGHVLEEGFRKLCHMLLCT